MQLTVICAALASSLVALRASGSPVWVVLIPTVAAGLGSYGWSRLNSPVSGSIGLGFVAAGLAVALCGLFMSGSSGASALSFVLIAAPFLLILIAGKLPDGLQFYLLIPLIFALVCLGSALLAGDLTAGGFPAALAFLLSVVLHATRRMEVGTEAPTDPSNHPEVHRIHRHTLAKISIIFFLFGVICLWPWLGKIYGNGYFWITVAGVLVPIMLYWGRLRQPRSETSYEALIRFNRLAPYLVLMLAVALIVG
jgi:hypothetical protein